MLKHCVFLSLADPSDLAALDRPMELLQGLVGQVPGMIDFAHGPNRDFEAKTPSHTYGFVVTFSDRAAHLAYETHPDHIEAGGLLIAACKDGYEGILVADLETAG